MKTVHVDLGRRSYDIRIGTNLAVGDSAALSGNSRALIVSDSHVDPLHGASCEESLRKHGVTVSRAVVPSGEGSKDLALARELYGKALAAGLDRASVIVALGGGVVGDLAGFVAGTYMRGIRLIQVPTSLLAMVDSSVGGKTGVNLAEGKNMVGVFHQPVEVVADLLFLRTLPAREYVSGLAEVIKYGVIRDGELFGQLEKNTDRVLSRDVGLLEEVIARCCTIKSEVVAADEQESGLRALLNFGHTFGHGLENVLGYGTCSHGEAVALGMVFAGEVSALERRFPRESCVRLRSLLRDMGLPIDLSSLQTRVTWPEVRAAMRADKKSRGDSLRLVLADRLGSAVFGCEVPDEVLEKGFGRMGGR